MGMPRLDQPTISGDFGSEHFWQMGVGGPVNVVDGNCDTNEMNTTSAP